MKGNNNILIHDKEENIVKKFRRCIKNERDLIVEDEANILMEIKGLPFAPEVVYSDENILIYKYIEGNTANDIFGSFGQFPKEVITKLVHMLKILHTFKCKNMSSPKGITNSLEFFSFYKKFIINTIKEFYRRNYMLFKLGLNLTEEDLSTYINSLSISQRRELCLCHADAHRKNILLTPDQSIMLIDWELGLRGDPIYDMAVHLYKCRYDSQNKEFFLNAYGVEETDKGDIDIYSKTLAVRDMVLDLPLVIVDPSEEMIQKQVVKTNTALGLLGKSRNDTEEVLRSYLRSV